MLLRCMRVPRGAGCLWASSSACASRAASAVHGPTQCLTCSAGKFTDRDGLTYCSSCSEAGAGGRKLAALCLAGRYPPDVRDAAPANRRRAELASGSRPPLPAGGCPVPPGLPTAISAALRWRQETPSTCSTCLFDVTDVASDASNRLYRQPMFSTETEEWIRLSIIVHDAV